MVYLKEKKIKGKKYYYLSKSFRLSNGKVRTIEKSVGKEKDDAEKLFEKYKKFFLEREKKTFSDFASEHYSHNSVFIKEQIKKAEEMKVEYNYILNEFSKEQKQDVWDRFIANFTYESNAIEGNSLTLKDVAIVMFENQTVEGKELREIWETKNSRKVMQKMLNGKYSINEKDIIKMHRDLMENIDSRTGYKKFPNEVIGSNVERTPPEKVEEEMKNLLDWHKQATEKKHPLQVSALFHGKFEKIHPFADGNGRVGRFLSLLILTERNYPPFIIRKSQRQSYYKCLEDFHKKNYAGNLERFFLDKYKKTYRKFFQGYKKYILTK